MHRGKSLIARLRGGLNGERAGALLVALAAGALMVFIGAAVTLSLIAGAAPKPEKMTDITVAQAMEALIAPREPGAFAVASHPHNSDADDLPATITAATEVPEDPLTQNHAGLSPAALQDLLNPPDCVSELQKLLAPMAVQFDLGSAVLRAESRQMLSQISDEIIICQEAYVVVAGHADTSGEDTVNQALSLARADQTLSRLIALGVDPNAAEAVGFGAQEPLSQGSDEEDSADRRVEFRVMRRHSD